MFEGINVRSLQTLETWPKKYEARVSFLPWAKALAIGTNSEVILEEGVQKINLQSQ